MTRRSDVDVIVVGAGAGGAASACFLTQAGLRVLVLEKASLPRYKACGGAIPWATLKRFPFPIDGVVRATPTEVRVTYPGLAPVQIPLPDKPVALVMRSEFDTYLLECSGADVWDEMPVTAVTEGRDTVQVEAGGRKVTARYLVGADGAVSMVARSLGLRPNRRLGGTLEVEVPVDGRDDVPALEPEPVREGARVVGFVGDPLESSRSEQNPSSPRTQAIFSLGVVPGGYAWVFPKGDLLSVGVGRFRPGRVDLRGALRRELRCQGIDPDGLRPVGHPIPCYRARSWLLWRVKPQETLSTRRCLLVGDAGGLVDPLLGEGIRYAIASARLAARAIANDDLTGYEMAIWREIGHSLATADRTARLFYRWQKRCFQLGVRNPMIVRHFADLLADRMGYQGIGRRLATATVQRLLGRQVRSKSAV